MPAKTCPRICKSVYISRIWNIFRGICRIPLPALDCFDHMNNHHTFFLSFAWLSLSGVYNWRIVDCYRDGCERLCGKVGCSGQQRLELQKCSDGAHSPGGDEENREHRANTGPTVLLSLCHGWQSVQWSQLSSCPCPDALQKVSLWRRQGEMHMFAPEGSGRYYSNYRVNS